MPKQRFISISPGFFLIMVLLARSRVGKPLELVTWLIVVTVSVLVHELGHAFAARRFGCHPTIALHMMGGTTSYSIKDTLSRGRRILISAAGPGSGLLLGGLVWAVHLGASGIIGAHPTAALIVRDALWVNIGWSLLNLLPVLPLDGGHITAQLVGKRPARWISIITAAAIAVAAVGYGYSWMGVLLGWLIIENGRTLWRKHQKKRDPPY